MKSKKTSTVQVQSINDTPWFPSLHLIKYAYRHNKTQYHSAPHALRVWLNAMRIAQNYTDKVDLDVLSAAAIFHDLGRTHDFNDPGHGLRSADWIDKNLSRYTEKFTQNQIEMIKILCTLHCLDDNHYSTLELKILKDADALERVRLPFGKLDSSYLRLKESEREITYAKDVYVYWRHAYRKDKNLRNTFTETVKYFSLELSESKYLNESTKEEKHDDYQLLNIEKRLHKVELLALKIPHELIMGRRATASTRSLNRELDELNFLTEDNEFLQHSIEQLIYHSVVSPLKLCIYDKAAISTELGAIANIYRRCKAYSNNKSVIPSLDSILQIVNARNYSKLGRLRTAIIDTLAKENRLEHLNILLDENSSRKSFVERNSITKRLKDNTVGTLFNILGYRYEVISDWLLIRSIETSISRAENDINAGLTSKGEHTLVNIVAIIVNRISKNNLTLEKINALLNSVIKITEIERRKQIECSTKSIIELWQSSELSVGSGYIYRGFGVRNALNLFYYFDGSRKNIGEHLKLLEKLIQIAAKRGDDVDNVIVRYLLPLSLSPEFKYSVSDSVIQKIKDPNLIELTNALLTKGEEVYDEYDYKKLIAYYNRESSRNIEKLVGNGDKFKSLASAKNDHRIVSNLRDLQLLHSISTSNGVLLSAVWNVLRAPKYTKLNLSPENIYLLRTKHRDLIQRDMIIRRPNSVQDHPYYGTMQSLSNITEKNLLSLIPTPTDVIMKHRYGEVILVFKKYISDRTLFTLLDSSCEYRRNPVTFEDAKILYEYVKSKSVIRSVRTNPMTLITWYVEAQILGGVSLKDIETIYLPAKLTKSSKNRTLISEIESNYPNIEYKYY